MRKVWPFGAVSAPQARRWHGAAGLGVMLGTLALAGCLRPAPGCDAGGYDSLVGTNIAAITLPADPEIRVLRIGDLATTDFRPTRVNIEIDDAGLVQRVFCG